jgi:aspartate kinase
MAIQMTMDQSAGSMGGRGKLDRLVRELRKVGTVSYSLHSLLTIMNHNWSVGHQQVSVHHDMAILSLVGSQMKSLVGMSGLFFTTLGEGNVNIEMISQGASEINISCVIKGKDAVKALNLVHQSCLQIRPEGSRGRGVS